MKTATKPSDRLESKIMRIVLDELEGEIQLPAGFLVALLDVESDWDFLVKLATVLEALLTRAIMLESGKTLSYKTVSTEGQAKRLLRAKEFGLVQKTERKALIAISEIRNAFVHRIENLARPFAEYFKNEEPQRQRDLARAIVDAGALGKTRDQAAVDDFPNDFRRIMMLGLFPIFLKLGYAHKNKERDRKHAEWRVAQELKLGRKLPPRTDFYLADKLMVLELVAAETLRS